MTFKRIEPIALVVARSLLAAAAIFYAYRYMPAFFGMWDTKQPLQWWAGRATGFGAYAALAASMVFGLMVSSRGLDGAVNRKTVTDYHQQWTLAALVLTVIHTLVIVTDKYVDISVIGSLVPGRSAHMTGAVALGTFALWGMIIIVLSSWARSLLSYEAWRAIHASATAVILLALAHGFIAGSDSKYELVRVLYAGSGAAIFGATIFRLAYEFRRPRAPGTARPTAPTAPAAAGARRSTPAAAAPPSHEPQPAEDGSILLDLATARRERAGVDESPLPRAHGRQA
ncbi:MAG: ferric reductase-like transmembrane domain-containing protein [Dehalococcoidia bacterium]